MRRLCTFAALPLIAALSLPASAPAQQPLPPGAAPGKSGQPAPQPSKRPPMPIVDVDFKGGTVQDFIKAVQAGAEQSDAKTPVNVMIPSEAAEVRMQAVSLRRVSAETALETLQFAFGMQGPHQFDAANMTNGGDEGLTFAIRYSSPRTPQVNQGMPPMQPSVSQAYSLQNLLITPSGLAQSDPSLRMSSDAVLGALKVAAELETTDSRVTPTQFMFHPDTQLLIARGTPDQHRLIEGVLEQLTNTIRTRRDEMSDAASRKRNDELQQIEFDAQLVAVQSQLNRAVSELRPADAELDRIEKLVASGSASTADLERARAQREVAKTNVAAAEAQVKMVERRRAMLSAANGSLPATLPAADQFVVIYDLRDLASFKADFYDLVKHIIGKDGKMDVRPISGDSTGSIVVRATRDQHESLVRIFNTARRLKSNEPKLPGMTLDQLIEKAPKE